MSKAKTEIVEVTKGFLEYRESELRKSRERLRAARAKLRGMERDNEQLRNSLDIMSKGNGLLSMELSRRVERLRGRRPADGGAAMGPAAGEGDGMEPLAPIAAPQTHLGLRELRRAIEEGYEVSRERALALTKLDECAMWLGRAEAAGAKEEE